MKQELFICYPTPKVLNLTNNYSRITSSSSIDEEISIKILQ
jgi:hypothetical protein